MSQFIKYLDDIKAVTGSDYKTAQTVGMTRSMMSKVRSGGCGLSNEFELALSRIIDINPAKFHAAVAEHVAKTPESKKAWNNALKNIAASIVIGVMLLPAPVVEASHYILC